jgi:cytochrome c oxidase subunit 3/cytochrome c oxidase subunit I+III
MSELPLAEPAKQRPAAAASLRVARPNGWWGMAMLVATEGTLFGVLVASYFYLRFKSVEWPPPGVPRPELVVPIVLTAVLVSTSLPMQLAQSAIRRGRLGTTRALLLLALVVQAGYFAMQVSRFGDSLDRFTLQDNAYASIYYTLLGAHHAHVLVGLALDLWLLGKLARGITNYRLIATESIVLYWHFVNALAIVVTATLLSAA